MRVSSRKMVLDLDVTKVIARMTREQTVALTLFQRLGFVEEAVWRDHALDANGLSHDLLMLSFHTRPPGTMLRVLRRSRAGSVGPGWRQALLCLLRLPV